MVMVNILVWNNLYLYLDQDQHLYMKNPYQDEETFLHGSSLEPNVPRVRGDHKEIDKARQSSQPGYDFWPKGPFVMVLVLFMTAEMVMSIISHDHSWRRRWWCSPRGTPSGQSSPNSASSYKGKRRGDSSWLGGLLHSGRYFRHHRHNRCPFYLRHHQHSLCSFHQLAMHIFGEEEPKKVVASSLGFTEDGNFWLGHFSPPAKLFAKLRRLWIWLGRLQTHLIEGVDLGLSVALHFSNNRMATFVTDLRVIMTTLSIWLGPGFINICFGFSLSFSKVDLPCEADIGCFGGDKIRWFLLLSRIFFLSQSWTFSDKWDVAPRPTIWFH